MLSQMIAAASEISGSKGVPYHVSTAILALNVSEDMLYCKWLIVGLSVEKTRSTSTEVAEQVDRLVLIATRNAWTRTWCG